MKLEGLKVIHLSWFLPGPYLTLALADHGAEVIKVEPPGEGDPGRHIRPADERSSVFFRNMGRGKKSVVLDLKTPEGLEQALAIADTACIRAAISSRNGIIEATRARKRNSGEPGG